MKRLTLTIILVLSWAYQTPQAFAEILNESCSKITLCSYPPSLDAILLHPWKRNCKFRDGKEITTAFVA